MKRNKPDHRKWIISDPEPIHSSPDIQDLTERLASIYVLAEEIAYQFGNGVSKSSMFAAKTARKIMKIARGK